MSVKKSVNSEQQKWQAQDDARILIMSEKIYIDRARHRRAIKELDVIREKAEVEARLAEKIKGKTK